MLNSILMQQVATLFGKTATIKNGSLLCDDNDIYHSETTFIAKYQYPYTKPQTIR